MAVVSRKLNTLPVGHRRAPVPGAALIGDAAHLGPPDDKGAWAMFDAAELVLAPATRPDSGGHCLRGCHAPRAATAASDAGPVQGNRGT